MRTLEEIIQFENENTALDFKAKQYHKGNHEAFLKDIISMANGKSNDRKLIVIGVKHRPNGEREILGVSNDFIDEASYQQIVHENIEPEIKLSYLPITLNGKQLGVFELSDCFDQPFMMKKNFKNLKKGDSFIRKGSHQSRISRQDIDYFISNKLNAKSFKDQVAINFKENGKKELILEPISNLEFPSEKAREKIEKILNEKEAKLRSQQGIPALIFDQDFFMPGGTPYENRSIDTLKKNLKNVEKTYAKDDSYYLFETKSHRLNHSMINHGKEYIEDASIELVIKKNSSFLIADRIFEEPDNTHWFYTMNKPSIPPSWEYLNYPQVNETDTEYKIFENIGDIKHLIECSAFKVPFRMVCHSSCIGNEINIKVSLFAKNLQKPIEENLKIRLEE